MLVVACGGDESHALIGDIMAQAALKQTAIPEIQFNAKSIVTNTTPTVAYRGAGRPEATAAIERAMDLFAAEIEMDPAEVRRVNLIPKDQRRWRASATAPKFNFWMPTNGMHSCVRRRGG